MRASDGGRRRLSAALTIMLLVAACGVEPQRDPERVPADRVPAADTTGEAAATRVRVWRTSGQAVEPVFVRRVGPGVAGRIRSLLALGDGEPPLPTAVPTGTRLVRVELRRDVTAIDVTGELLTVEDGQRMLALAQLVLTATEDPDVLAVVVRADGQPVLLRDATGHAVQPPLRAEDFFPLVRQ